jgi:ATP-dependent DNA helicase RecG
MNLQDILSIHFRLNSDHQKALKKLGLLTIEDLLNYLPVRYENISDVQSISGLQKGQDTVVYGQLTGLKTRKAWKSKVPIGEAYVEDGSAKIKVMWFNQPYIAKMYHEGAYVKLAGKVAGSENKIYLSNPEVELLNNLPIDRHDSIFKGSEIDEDTLYPIYRETKGITSKWLYHAVMKCFEKGILDKITDPLPSEILKPYKLPDLKTALIWIHSPKKAEHKEVARKRFAFEEVFYIQVQKARERATAKRCLTYHIQTSIKIILKNLPIGFPFPLTKSQKNRLKL